MEDVKCKCGETCEVDGEYPKFFAWCETCNDYADVDMNEYTADYLASKIDYAYDTYKDRMLDERDDS